jgi:uncharacterized protein
MTTRTRTVRMGALLLVLILAGCALLNPGPQPKTRFFMLSSLASAPAAPSAAMPSPGVIGVGPIRVPEYLDRRTIIIRSSRNEFEIAEVSQWAEPLGDIFARVLADNLAVLLDTPRVALFPWRSSLPVDRQVAVQVAQFDGMLGGPVVLRAHWQIYSGDGKRILDSGYSLLEEKAHDTTIDALVSAESRAAERFSREIAAAMARLRK